VAPVAHGRGRRSAAKHRDARQTRERILEAATNEFAARGFAGARIGRIARHAGVNRAMLYYYFLSKRGLFEETLRRASIRAGNWDEADPVGSLVRWFRTVVQDPRSVRLLQWETLEGQVHRTDASGPQIEAFASLVRLFGDAADARHKAFLVVSATLLPIALPGLTEKLVGRSPSEAIFESAHERWIRLLIGLLSEHRSVVRE
jgi:TetR/AcrR family transcriptional regulator